MSSRQFLEGTPGQSFPILTYAAPSRTNGFENLPGVGGAEEASSIWDQEQPARTALAPDLYLVSESSGLRNTV